MLCIQLERTSLNKNLLFVLVISGDIMGSVLTNLDSILKMPTGCGEQNMIKFAPNIYVLDYLTNTNQLTTEIEDKALEYLRIGRYNFMCSH